MKQSNNYERAERICEEAYKELFPEKTLPKLTITFSKKFSPFNANVKYYGNKSNMTELRFSLSNEFTESEDEIIKGLLQHLMNKVYGTKKITMEQELYQSFLKHLPNYSPRQESDPELERLFAEINEEYFAGLMEQPTIVFGQDSTTVMGHYNYQQDKITISNILKKNPQLMKFVLYHEMLHKKHGFKTNNNRSYYHTKQFREDEKKFAVKDIEQQLEKFVKKEKIKNLFRW